MSAFRKTKADVADRGPMDIDVVTRFATGLGSQTASASRIRFVIASGCEISARWLASISIVFADILVAHGTEAGGHGSRSTFPFVPAVVDAVPNIPVAAAGGVADGRGIAAALMLGAEGVLVGTRFYASQEAAGRGAAKQRIAEATGDQTVRGILFDIALRNVWPAPYTGRLLRNKFSEKWRGREAELLHHQNEEAKEYSAAREKGDFDIAGVVGGEAVDLIADIPPAGEIVDRMVNEATTLLSSASNRYRIVAQQS